MTCNNQKVANFAESLLDIFPYANKFYFNTWTYFEDFFISVFSSFLLSFPIPTFPSFLHHLLYGITRWV